MNRLFWASAFAAACASRSALPAPQHDLRAEHELVGSIWRTSDMQRVKAREVVSAARAAEVVMLGEKHDNADHHALQGWMIRQLRPDGVAFEMLDDADDVSATTPAALAEAVGWDKSGWPEFELYEPVFSATLDVGARVVTAHPTKAVLMGNMKGEPLEGHDDLPLHVELPAEQRAALVELIEEAHCGHASEAVVGMMISGQRLKDAWMARALSRIDGKAVLVAGGGHTVRARGVPLYLDREVVTVAFAEVHDGTNDPAEYGIDADYVWFTARVDEVDPCERYREQLEKMKR